jgi:ribonuclease-3
LTNFLDYGFRDPSLLEQALTHRSAGKDHNERLEFLGDAILGYLIAAHLYHEFPAADEGRLTRIRASLVNKETLAQIARTLELGAQIRLGEGERKSGGWRRDSILANTLEAVIGAIYLDGGMDACRKELTRWFHSHLAQVDPDDPGKDPKTELQEYLQARRLPLPTYETFEISGPPHNQVFTVKCSVEPLSEPVIASGRSRRSGEQNAASEVLKALDAVA